MSMDSDDGSDLMYLSPDSDIDLYPLSYGLAMANSETMAKKRPKEQKTPQEVIDEFWSKFTAKSPGKATTVVPQNQYTDKVARKTAKAASSSITTTASYDDAAAMCQAKVAKIVKECRRINKKYRDPHFDLESDLKLHSRDCLESLRNIAADDTNPGHKFQPKAAKRVVDIFDKPQFYIDGPSAADVRQGRDGDCWLMAALCLLSANPSLIEKLCVAHDQDVGVYGFVFHRDGEWISEIVDDFLYLTKPDYDESYVDRLLFDELERINPEEAYRKIYQTNSSALYFAQCRDPQETWLPLLEKCFAKAHGDYAAIEGGFGGEGIEDLTGGVTSELWTTDILDKEHFWKELLEVNKEFLFGCSTGVWGVQTGERKGIVELHAYAIQRAVEMDGKRLLRLKNPWGNGEWKGAWSDGSKEWTPEWLEKLEHRFGDDGDFWIAYDDLLRKYQAFERTRLFDKDWRVTQIWTTLMVPWAVDYHDTHFTFTISKPGPVVIVLAQLDDRYFRGLEGQYRYKLAFRLHKAGHEDYLVRSQHPYRMRRSINVELELEAGKYDVRVRIDATRYEGLSPIHEVIRTNVKYRREKLTRIGIAYDLAHGKGKIMETSEEKRAREVYEKRIKEKERRELKKKILTNREESHYLRVKKLQRDRKRRNKKSRAKKAEKGAPDTPVSVAGALEDLDKENEANGEEVEVIEEVSEPSKARETEHKGDINGKEDKNGDISDSTPEAKNGTSVDSVAKDSPSSPAPEELVNPTSTDTTLDEDGNEQGSGPVHFEKTNGVKSHSEPAMDSKSSETESNASLMKDSDAKQSDFEDEFSDIESLSELSDRELDIQIDSYQKEMSRPVPIPNPAKQTEEQEEKPDEFEKDPWNAVAVVGLRIYYKTTEDETSDEIVKLHVVRPNIYPDEEDEGEKSKGLDVDDSAKDATLKGGVKERKKSIMGDEKERKARA